MLPRFMLEELSDSWKLAWLSSLLTTLYPFPIRNLGDHSSMLSTLESLEEISDSRVALGDAPTHGTNPSHMPLTDIVRRA